MILLLTGCRSAGLPAAGPTATAPQVVAFQTATPEPATPAPLTSTAVVSPSLLTGPALIAALQQGGYVIFFRHAATYRSQLDTDQQNLENCQTQRNLNEAGQAQARTIGEAFRQAQIPVGTILASPYCRTRDTAQLAFGRVELSQDLIGPYADDADEAELAQKLRSLLAMPPGEGTNTILVGHSPNLLAATGLSIVEGEAAIYAPGREGEFTLIGRVLPEAWTVLSSNLAN